MKNIKWLFIALMATTLWSCSEENLESNSIFGKPVGVVTNEFDTWLQKNYIDIYNVEFKYRFEDKESDSEYNLLPAHYNKSIALAKMTKHVWLEAYEELLDKDFVRTYCPKILNLVGSVGYDSQGSVVLGTAEGGMKITLYNVNAIDIKKPDLAMLNHWFFKTMHHEFAHILHQTKNYSTDFNLITPSSYQAGSWVNIREKAALDMGFVTPYASSETQEDFVEIIAVYVTNTQEYWDKHVGKASAEGQGFINQKLGLVREYLTEKWGIDMDALREIVLRRTADIPNMDLETLN